MVRSQKMFGMLSIALAAILRFTELGLRHREDK